MDGTTQREQLAAIREIVERLELRAIEDRLAYSLIVERVSKLERAWNYLLGAGAGLGTATTLYLKSLFK